MDSGTMVRAAGDEMGTVRVASTVSDGAGTMIEHGDTLPSQLGTMVINAEDEEEEGTMKSKALLKYTPSSDNPHAFQGKPAHIVHSTGWSHFLIVQGWGVREGRAGLRRQRQESVSNEEGPSFEPEWPPLIECCHFPSFSLIRGGKHRYCFDA